jgi:hypothetical protein
MPHVGLGQVRDVPRPWPRPQCALERGFSYALNDDGFHSEDVQIRRSGLAVSGGFRVEARGRHPVSLFTTSTTPCRPGRCR